jgi:hypothetical protein
MSAVATFTLLAVLQARPAFREGEARQASRTSLDDSSSGRHGGLCSHRGLGGRTRHQLYEEARRRESKAGPG